MEQSDNKIRFFGLPMDYHSVFEQKDGSKAGYATDKNQKKLLQKLLEENYDLGSYVLVMTLSEDNVGGLTNFYIKDGKISRDNNSMPFAGRMNNEILILTNGGNLCKEEFSIVYLGKHANEMRSYLAKRYVVSNGEKKKEVKEEPREEKKKAGIFGLKF